MVYYATLGKKTNVVVKNLSSAIIPGSDGQVEDFIRFCRDFHPIVQKGWVFALNVVFPILIKHGVSFHMLTAKTKEEGTLLYQKIFSVYLALGKKQRRKWFQAQVKTLLNLFTDGLPLDAASAIEVSFYMIWL